MSVAQRERAALVEILRAVGPDAPTLCEGWTTRDLVAHLVVRERRPDALPGLVFRPLASYTARVQNRLSTSTKWEDLVELFASGPPVLSLFKVLDPLASIHEMFVHHEDVRRAQTGWEPRELDARTTAGGEAAHRDDQPGRDVEVDGRGARSADAAHPRRSDGGGGR
jgi:uncharacterized protein (TIGR03085 family)